ncbi:sensor histidine kinase [Reichenbachiella agarivorans]|uniref:histidine kinase n=1 Tax=Reichenbachiella agarivorans TaxID=2979464 RepID=A0ABY6CMB1_9BACT|nr:sensor histidine kinase [Reichenbachiella agarivorans]UXP31655.1 sensor histidine kinase [Reichenbachiella agarivorans]
MKSVSIRLWTTLMINMLILLTVSALSVFFYQQFQQALNDRVLLHLASIKNLKCVQIEHYLETEWQAFLSRRETEVEDEFYTTDPEKYLCEEFSFGQRDILSGIYDVSKCDEQGEIVLAFIQTLIGGEYRVEVKRMPRIQEILLERTGMGNSGETYLVGGDSSLRSVSRFFPGQTPSSIFAHTRGVDSSLAGQDSTGVFKDYRGVEVFSAYQRIEIANLNWGILSEMDVEEVNKPLSELRIKLLMITVLVLIMSVALSFFLTDIFSKPLIKMRDLLHSMSQGQFDISFSKFYPAMEINQMFIALDELKNSINGAIQFSHELGRMNLEANHKLSGDSDVLGQSLTLMQKRLIDFKKKEEQNRLLSKQSLITGQENERKRLSRELHDGLGPLLTTLKLSVQSADLEDIEKQKIKKMVDETISTIRSMSYNLMPHALIDFGVGKALENFVELIRKSSPLKIHYVNSTRDDDSKLNSEMNICIFRVCQELINNTLKHAQANNIRLSLTEFDDKISLYYRDDGKGFNVDEAKLGSGLSNIRERVEVFNGYFTIHADDQGTEVEVEIPI